MVANCGATCAKYLLCLFNFTFFVSIFTSVGSEQKLGSAWLGFGLSFWAKKLGSACHTFQKSLD